ncbi:MAG TPA: tetratricopeptide repeat protein [Burkholderiaceae bacterium]
MIHSNAFHFPRRLACAGALLWACAAGTSAAPVALDEPANTNGDIALANLDGLIEQAAGEPGAVDLLLLRGQFLADHETLDRVASLTEPHDADAAQLLRRAHARAAAHRFYEAGLDLDAAQRAGAPADAVRAQRASLQVALGHADDTLPELRAQAARRPGFGSHCALALAEAAVGHIEAADALYDAALRDLDTTSPFPAAAVWFARGLMWSEQAGDPERGAAMYAQALREVPSYVPANLHLAEIQAARGDDADALAHLQRIVAISRDPESLALLGTLHERGGDAARGRDEIAQARGRFEDLLQRHPLAFADHAAEFYMGAGHDAERALYWARINLLARETRRAYTLAIRAAQAAQRMDEARDLETRRDARFDARAA